MHTRFFVKASDRFEVCFTEGIVDTIKKNGKMISAAHADAKTIVRYSESLILGIIPPKMAGSGWAKAPHTPWRAP